MFLILPRLDLIESGKWKSIQKKINCCRHISSSLCMLHVIWIYSDTWKDLFVGHVEKWGVETLARGQYLIKEVSCFCVRLWNILFHSLTHKHQTSFSDTCDPRLSRYRFFGYRIWNFVGSVIELVETICKIPKFCWCVVWRCFIRCFTAHSTRKLMFKKFLMLNGL